MSHLMNTYARLPVAFTRGEGVWLWDTQGKRYLDALAGVAVNAIGHSHPKLVAALRDQVGKLIHTSNIYHIEAQEKLADKIAQLSGMETVFFCNSGAEANEAAIKIARYYGHKKGVENPNIVVLEKSFHVARSPHFQPPAAARCKRVSNRWCRALYACRLTTWKPCAAWQPPTKTSSRY